MLILGADQLCTVLGDFSRTSLAFRLMPRMNATIDCKAVAQAGHPFKGYGPVLVQTFLDALAAAELAHGSYSKIVRFSTSLLFPLLFRIPFNYIVVL